MVERQAVSGLRTQQGMEKQSRRVATLQPRVKDTVTDGEIRLRMGDAVKPLASFLGPGTVGSQPQELIPVMLSLV
jgi:hypothetical protein